MSKQCIHDSENSNITDSEITLDSSPDSFSNIIFSDTSMSSIPESSGIVCAEPISTFIPECRITVGKIIIKITDTVDKINYVRHLTEKSDIWIRNSKYFPDFNSVYIAIHPSLKNENESVDSNITRSGHQEITIVFTHEGLHSFIIPIILQKEEDRIDRMEKNIERLFNENKYLKEQIESIRVSLQNKETPEKNVVIKKRSDE